MAALSVLGALALGSTPAAASTCGDRVLTDWTDGRIDGVYPLHCYDEAVDDLPEDVRTYSSAADDISRALQTRLHSGSAREADTQISAADVPSPADSGAAQTPIVLLVLAVAAGALAVAAVSAWSVRRLRRRT